MKDSTGADEKRKSKDGAFDVLGLQESASFRDIENRYNVLLKKHKAIVNSGETPDFDISEITAAYELLMGIEHFQPEEGKRSPLFKKLGIDERKLKTFFSYNKWNIIFAILGIIFAVSIIETVTRPRPDFKMAFLGAIRSSNSVEIEAAVEESIEEIKYAYIDDATGAGDDPYMVIPQKETALIASGGIDVFVVDRDKYDHYAALGLFVNLDPYIEDLRIQDEEYADLITSSDEDPSPHLYGIDVTESSIFSRLGVKPYIEKSDRIIAGICYKSKRLELSLKVLKLLEE